MIIAQSSVLPYNADMEAVLRHVRHKDPLTYRHCENVCAVIAMFIKHLELPAEDRRIITESGRLHDVGKILINSAILKKPSTLSLAELNEIQQHSLLGYEYLHAYTCFQVHAQYTLHHHERWDGTGYPHGLRKENIPLGSRIVAIADAYEAMVALRSYRKPLTITEALVEIENNSGTQFDPKLTAIFIQSVRDNKNQSSTIRE